MTSFKGLKVVQQSDPYINLTAHYLNTNVHINIQNGWSLPDYEVWAPVLIDRGTWRAESSIKVIMHMHLHEQVFIESLINLYQVLCTLARLPVFNLPTIVGVKSTVSALEKIQLELQLPVIQLIPSKIHKNILSAVLTLCNWMIKHPASQKNIRIAFDFVDKKILKEISNQIPAGTSTIPTLQAAHKLGIPFMHIGFGVYQLGWGSKRQLLNRSTTDLDSAIGVTLTQNKISTANVLRLAGLPAPVHHLVKTQKEAFSAASQLGYPIVVKPVDQDRGEGVTTEIHNEDSLKNAFNLAHSCTASGQVLIERQAAGVCHRLFVTGTELLYAVKRLPMSIRGDGVKTIAQLVDEEVTKQSLKAPWLRTRIQPIDALARESLKRANFSDHSIPLKGVWAPLRPIESSEWGGVDEDVTKLIHPDNVSAAIIATKCLGLHVAGVDMISVDIAQPWHQNHAVINEINFAPLLGGAEISKSYLPTFFQYLIDGNGKIPIQLVDQEQDALDIQETHIKHGRRCFITSFNQTTDFTGQTVFMPFDDLKQRVMALLYRSDVDAIVVIVTLSQKT